MQTINKIKGFKVAIDVPTGINPKTGNVQEDAVRADLTIALHKIKTEITIILILPISSLRLL